MIDQFLLYDQALLTWLNDMLPPLIKGRTTQLLYAISRKAFAEVTTRQLVDNETLTLPRISITKLDPTNDPVRYNAARVRRLGWCVNDDNSHSKIRSGRHPAPIQLNYQVDLWTRFMSEMNRWMQLLLFEFSPSYIYLQIRPDDVWQNKQYIVFLDGGINDNSDLEPDERERIVRRTFNLRAECWVFDQNLLPQSVVKRFEMQWYDRASDTLLETMWLPPLEVIGTGNDIEVNFSDTLNRPPILADTPVVQTVIGGTTEIALDDRAGNLAGPRTSGTIDYVTGDISLTFTAPPDSGEDVTITYFTDLS